MIAVRNFAYWLKPVVLLVSFFSLHQPLNAQRGQGLVEHAREAARADRNAEAARLFEQFTEIAPGRRIDILREWAEQLTYSGQAAKAVPLFEEALEKDELSRDEKRETRLGLALALAWSGRWRESLAHYDRLLDANPADGPVRVQRSQRILEAAREAASKDRNVEAAELFRMFNREAPERRLESLLEWADQLSFSGRGAEAIPLYREALTYNQMERSKLLQARLGLARALAWNDQVSESLRTYDASAAAVPKEADAVNAWRGLLLDQARASARTDRNSLSASLFETAVRSMPGRPPSILCEWADQLVYSGRPAQAIPLYVEALAGVDLGAKERRSTQLGLALAYSWTDQLERALAVYTALLEGAPSDPDLRALHILTRAREAARRDRSHEAATLFAEAIVLDPRNRSHWLGEYADQLIYAGRNAEAVPLYQELLDSTSLTADQRRKTRLMLGLGLSRTGDLAGALEQYDALLAANPEDAEVAFLRTVAKARAAARADRNEESADLFERALEILPLRRNEILREFADQLSYAGRATEAVHKYREALQLGVLAPLEERQARLGLALALCFASRFEESLAVYDSMLAETAGDTDTLALRLAVQARWAAQSDHNTEAVRLFEQAIATAPALRPEWVRELSDQLRYLGRYEEAITLYHEVLASGQLTAADRRSASLGLAEALARNGKLNSALDIYDLLLSKNPDDQHVLAKRLVVDAREAARTNRNADSAELFRKAMETDVSMRAELARELADQLRFTDRPLEALLLYEEALAWPKLKAADRRHAQLGMVHALCEGQQIDRALMVLDDLLSTHPNQSEIAFLRTLLLARDAARRDRNVEAAHLFHQAVRQAPAREHAPLRELADQLTFTDRAGQAIPLYREVLGSPELSNSERRRARIGLALALSLEGSFEGALEQYDLLLEVDPYDTTVMGQRLVYQAREAARKDRNVEAATYFEQALATDPSQRLLVLPELADQLSFSGRQDEALRLYREALGGLHGGARDAIHIRLALARALYWSGRLDEALHEYEQVASENPEHEKAQLERKVAQARSAAARGRHREAATLFAEAAGQAPDRRSEWLTEWADQLTYSGNPRAAEPLFEEALASGNLSPAQERRARLSMALALSWSSRLRKSSSLYESLLAVDPQDADARLGRARILSWRNRLSLATKEYQSVLQVDRGSIEARRDLARMESWRGRHRAASRQLDEFLRRYPGDSEAILLLAQTKDWMGRTDLGLESLRGLAQREPENLRARSALEEMELRLRPAHRVTYQTSAQSDDLDISKASIEQQFSAREGLSSFGIMYENHRYDSARGERLDVWRPGASLRHRANELLELNGYIFVDRISPEGSATSSLLTYDSWLSVTPTDQLRLYIGSKRTTFDNLRSLRQNITGDFASISTDYLPDERTVVSARFDTAWYSDSNRRTWGQAEVQYAVWPRPKLLLGGRYTAFGFRKRLDNGYFNPDFYQAAEVTARLHGFCGKRLEHDLGGSFGTESASPGGQKPLVTLQGMVRYRASKRLDLRLRFHSFDSRQASSGGFARRTIQVEMGYLW